MPVVSIMKMQGNTDELLEKMRGVDEVAQRLAPAHGGLLNIVAKTDDGVMVINLWENEQGRHDMAAEPEIQQAIQSAGLPGPGFEGYEVERIRGGDRIGEFSSS